MNQDDIIKKLEKLDLPQVELKRHQQMLKTVLFERKPKSVSLFSQSMFFLKKFSWVGLVPLILVAVWFSVSIKPAQQLTYAQEKLFHSIQDLYSNKNTSPELSVLIGVLEEALKDQELRYLGEEGTENKIQKFTYKPNDFNSEMVILIDPSLESHYGVSIYPADYEGNIDIALVINDQGEILIPQEKKDLLLSQQIDSPWIEKFVHLQNSYLLDDFERTIGEIKSYKSHESSSLDDNFLKILPELRSIFSQSDLLIMGYSSTSNDGSKLATFSLNVRTLDGYAERKSFAMKKLNEIQSVLNTLSSSQPDFFSELIQYAFKADDLRFYASDFDYEKDLNSDLRFGIRYGSTPLFIKLTVEPEFFVEKNIQFIRLRVEYEGPMRPRNRENVLFQLAQGEIINRLEIVNILNSSVAIPEFESQLLFVANAEKIQSLVLEGVIDSYIAQKIQQEFLHTNKVITHISFSALQNGDQGVALTFELVPLL